jgi:hypothetical protein
MAQGEVFVFDQFLLNTLKGNPDNPIDLGGTPDVLKCAIVSNATVPATTTANPCWGAGGTTNFATNEQTGTNYPAGGKSMGSVAVTNNAGTIELDFADPTVWSQNAGNPTTCYWGIVYSDTAANKNCIAYVDLGGLFNATTGDLTITWGAPFATLNQA